MRERIKDFVIGAIEVRSHLPTEIDIDTFNYVDTGCVDSIGMIKFVLEIETEFGIEISSADIEQVAFKTVGGLVRIIEDKLKKSAADND